MKLLAWMKQKLGGRDSTNNKQNINHSLLQFDALEPESPNQEIRNWPHGLLTIGTLGSTGTLKHAADVPQEAPCFQDPESVIFTNTLNCHDDSDNIENQDVLHHHHDDEIDSKTLSCPSNKGKDLLPDQHPSNINISNKSLSFLLKKAFVCNGGGFSSPPSPRGLTDQLPPDSTMEKILKAILNKKIYPANPAALSRKIYLDNRHKKKQLHSQAIDNESDRYGDHETDDHKLQSTGDKASKWDKTDSEYIVLEI